MDLEHTLWDRKHCFIWQTNNNWLLPQARNMPKQEGCSFICAFLQSQCTSAKLSHGDWFFGLLKDNWPMSDHKLQNPVADSWIWWGTIRWHWTARGSGGEILLYRCIMAVKQEQALLEAQLQCFPQHFALQITADHHKQNNQNGRKKCCTVEWKPSETSF